MQRVTLLKDVNTTASNHTSPRVCQLAVNGWIPCRQELPPVETEVLILVKGKRRIGALEWDIAGVEDSYKSYNYWDDPENTGMDWDWNDVTHWQHLPPVIELH